VAVSTSSLLTFKRTNSLGFRPLRNGGPSNKCRGDRSQRQSDTLHGENPKRVRDAVIALTAAAEAEDVEAFVTVDDRLARRVRAKAKTLKV
jgi:predicted nucleic acid-binding protein